MATIGTGRKNGPIGRRGGARIGSDGDAAALSRYERDAIFARFLADAQQCIVLGLTQPVIQDAATLLFSGPPTIRLRTLDALHLASARGGFNRARLEAARWAGLLATNPEDYP
ncbi:MAG: hypothetical protein ACRDIY_15230 [Chloroflexota bacterium]